MGSSSTRFGGKSEITEKSVFDLNPFFPLTSATGRAQAAMMELGLVGRQAGRQAGSSGVY